MLEENRDEREEACTLGDLLETEVVVPAPVAARVGVVEGARPRERDVVAEVGLIAHLHDTQSQETAKAHRCLP